MSDQLKFIVSELQKPPHSKTFNIITFDSLSGEQLLQTFNDVLAEIDSKHKVHYKQNVAKRFLKRFLDRYSGGGSGEDCGQVAGDAQDPEVQAAPPAD